MGVRLRPHDQCNRDTRIGMRLCPSNCYSKFLTSLTCSYLKRLFLARQSPSWQSRPRMTLSFSWNWKWTQLPLGHLAEHQLRFQTQVALRARPGSSLQYQQRRSPRFKRKHKSRYLGKLGLRSPSWWSWRDPGASRLWFLGIKQIAYILYCIL